MLDEFNTFRFLCGFVRPISVEFKTMEEIADAVASIPFEQTMLRPQWGGNVVTYSPTQSISSWLMGSSGDVATETLVGQVSSPSTIIVRRKASLIEHAILLCCFFRGIKVESYVAIGEVQHRPYAWVVSIFPFADQKRYLKHPHYKPAKIPSREKVVGYDDHYMKSTDFTRFEQVVEEAQFMSDHVVIHWDPLTGTPFNSKNAPFDLLHTLFNESNQYFNVQSTIRPSQYL
jgi:hypothetical protein